MGGWLYIKTAGKKSTDKHFLAMGASKATIYRTIQRYEEEGSYERRKIGTGRKAEKLPPAKVKRLIKDSVKKKEVSPRKLTSTKFPSHTFLKPLRRMMSNTGTPQVKLRKLKLQQVLYADTIFLLHGPTPIVMDDEFYFSLKDDSINGTTGFYILAQR